MTKADNLDEKSDEKSIFQKIIDREIPATIIDEDDDLIVIMDIAPVNHGHCLVIPKKPSVNILDMPDEDIAKVFCKAKQVGNALMKGCDADGVNIIMNNGAPAGQVVDHAHAHVIPRYKGDGLKHWGGGSYEGNEAEVIKQKLLKVLE